MPGRELVATLDLAENPGQPLQAALLGSQCLNLGEGGLIVGRPPPAEAGGERLFHLPPGCPIFGGPLGSTPGVERRVKPDSTASAGDCDGES